MAPWINALWFEDVGTENGTLAELSSGSFAQLHMAVPLGSLGVVWCLWEQQALSGGTWGIPSAKEHNSHPMSLYSSLKLEGLC